MKSFSLSSISLIIILLTASIGESVGQASSEVKATSPLFSDTRPLKIILSLDFKRLLEDSLETADYLQAVLIEENELGAKNEFAVKVRPTGNTRLNKNVCDFPPLRINFKKSELENTVFTGQDKLKLITHCREQDFDNFVMLEYLTYQSYGIFTEFNFKVRLATITYVDIAGHYNEITKTGFFVESEEQMATRNGGVISEKKIWSADSCRQSAVAMLTLFEFMIGNTDWWIHTQHNVVIVELPDGELIPVPFDFDYSGLVNTPYSVPSAQLPITGVRQRFLKGECRKIEYYREAINTYLAKKEAVLQLLNTEGNLDKRTRKESAGYIEDYFKIIESPELFNKYIKASCDYFSNPDSHLK